MKAQHVGLILMTVATVSQAEARPAYQVKCASGYTLKKDVLNPEWFECEKPGTTVTAATTCDAGEAYEVRGGITPKDRCTKTTTTLGTLQCRLLITDIRANWNVKHVAGTDDCESEKGKADKGVECTAGFTYKIDGSGINDTCTKSSESYSDPNCPVGYTYKVDGSRDSCTKTTAPSVIAPHF